MPLLSARSIKSLSRTSSISVRVNRAMLAMVNMDRAMLGSTLDINGSLAVYRKGNKLSLKPRL